MDQSRIQDPEKARVMALAGDRQREWASINNAAAEQLVEGTSSNGMPKDMIEDHSGYKKQAESHEKNAEMIENWAGILHDRPVSQEYKESHPEVSFRPEGLAHFEQHLEFLKRDLKRLSEQSEDYSLDWALNKLPVRLEESKDDEVLAGLASLLSDPKTTLHQLKQYFDLLDRLERQDIQEQVDKMSSVLEDVKSGRASELNSGNSVN
jgi:hypothetical protein